MDSRGKSDERQAVQTFYCGIQRGDRETHHADQTGIGDRKLPLRKVPGVLRTRVEEATDLRSAVS